MRRFFLILEALALALAAATATASAQPVQRVKVGTLTCDISAGIGMIIGSRKTVQCLFAPDMPGAEEAYQGSINKLGIDIGDVDLVICGEESSDGATAQVPPGIARFYVYDKSHSFVQLGNGVHCDVPNINGFEVPPLEVVPTKTMVGRLIDQLVSRLEPGGMALLEIESTCGPAALTRARQAFPNANSEIIKDLNNLDRLVKIEVI